MQKVIDKIVQFRIVISFVLAIIPQIVLNEIIRLFGQWGDYYGVAEFGYNMLSLVIYAINVFFLSKLMQEKNRRLLCVSLIGGIVLSVSTVCGAFLMFTNDLFPSAEQGMHVLWYSLGLVILAVPSYYMLMRLFDWLRDATKSFAGKEKGAALSAPVYFFIVWGILFVVYIPAFLYHWPGNFAYDTQYQLKAYVEGWYNMHHPLIHSMLVGKAYSLGVAMGNVSAGMQFYTIFQMLTLTGAFARTLVYMRSAGVTQIWRMIAFLWFALFPGNQLMAISCTKDVYCAAFFLLFVIYLLELRKEKSKWYTYVLVVCFGVLTCLFRNNMSYAIVAGGVIYAVVQCGLRQKAILLLLILGIFGGYKGANLILQNSVFSVEVDRYRESLSVPIQQLARVASYRREDLSDELYEQIAAYLDMDNSMYNPYLSDGMKNTANEELMREDFGAFLKLWIKVGLQFPDEYIESFLQNNMGYYYLLNKGVFTELSLQVGEHQAPGGEEIVYANNIPFMAGYFDTLFVDLKEVPVLGFLHRCSIWVWLIFSIWMWNVYQKKKEKQKIFWLIFAYLGTCFLGPVVFFRYIYCVIIAIPLLLCPVNDSIQSKTIETETKTEQTVCE